MKISILILILAAPFVTAGQTVSPVSSDYGHGKAQAQMTITNEQITPMVVSLSAFQFVVKDGHKQVLAALETGVTVKIAQSSFKIPPKQTRILDYSVLCPQGCNIEISAVMGAPSMRVQNGMLVKLQLGSIAYVSPANESGKDRRKAVLIAGGVTP